MESFASCFRSIYNFRHQDQPIRSSEVEVGELMKHGYFVPKVGFDAMRRGVMKPSKVILHRIFPPDRYRR